MARVVACTMHRLDNRHRSTVNESVQRSTDGPETIQGLVHRPPSTVHRPHSTLNCQSKPAYPYNHPSMANHATVLVVDDNDMMRKLLVAELSADPALQIEQAASGLEGLKKAEETQCSVIVLDMILPDMDGLKFLDRLRAVRPDSPSVIVITGTSAIAVPDGIIEGPYRGVVSAVFRKPFDHAKLRETVRFCAGV